MGPAGSDDRPALTDGLVKRSVRIAGHATSVSLEAPFWAALKAIAARRGIALNQLIGEIDEARTGNLSSALRVFVLRDAQNLADQGRAAT